MPSEGSFSPAADAGDAALVERARAGDRGAFDALVRRYSARVFGLVLRWMRDRDAAEETAQEAFVRAWSHLGQLQHGQEFRPWLFRIAVNAATDELRARKRRRPVPLADLSEGELGAAPGPDPEEATRGRRLAERLDEALARLSPDHRMVLLLRAREELSYEEIAAALHIPRGTVMSRLARARLELRAMLEGPEEVR